MKWKKHVSLCDSGLLDQAASFYSSNTLCCTLYVTSPPVAVDPWGQACDVEWATDVAGGRDAGISSAGAVPLTSAQMMGQPPPKKTKQKKTHMTSIKIQISLLIHLHLHSLWSFSSSSCSFALISSSSFCLFSSSHWWISFSSLRFRFSARPTRKQQITI